MRTHIDWLTFTMSMVYVDERADAYADAIAYGFEDMFGEQLRADAFGGNWTKNERSRAPYVDAWTNPDNGITLFASPNLTHCCVEISGKGCETLISKNLLDKVLKSCHSRVTRIDIASDIETQVSPLEFVKAVSHERMRTFGHVLSETGETCYVGSQKSERFARVYRYNAPHPRAHLLRVEHVYRKEYAKKVAEACAGSTLVQIAKSSGDAFGWCHSIWDLVEDNSPDISVIKERGKTGGTVFWLVHTVGPSFKKLVQEGVISDPEAFLRQFFLENKDA